MLFPSWKELLWGEGGLVLPVAGLVHVSSHPARSHRGHSLPLWPGLLQQLASHVSVLATPPYLRRRLGAEPSALLQKGGLRRRHGHVPALRPEV